MARKPDPTARDRILDIASRLFTEHGVHAVGLQQIIDECGCGKNTLYREFSSKDDLVVAFLERCRPGWTELTSAVAESHPGDPAAQLVAIVEFVAAQAAADDFRGCALRNAYSEFPDPSHPAHRTVVAYYVGRTADLRSLATRAGAADPEALADRIALIIDGLNANGPVLGMTGSARAATAFARDAVLAATG